MAIYFAHNSSVIDVSDCSNSVGATSSTVLSYDYKAKKAVAASSLSRLSNGAKLPPLESFDVPGQYAYANGGQAQRHADLQMEAREARSQLWRGRSTVRTLRAGTRLTVTGAPLQRLGEAAGYTILRVVSVGVNNLPSKAEEALAELFGPIAELLQEVVLDVPADFDLAIAQARKGGYANCFDAVASDVVWRPILTGSDGRAHPKPTACGAQTAIVVGADGGEVPAGADELHCDGLGRVRIRYHWQDGGDATCWVRVAQRLAGGGIGSQFLPRIGRKCWCSSSRTTSTGGSSSARSTTAWARTALRQHRGGEAAASDDGAALFQPGHYHGPSAQGTVAGGNAPVCMALRLAPQLYRPAPSPPNTRSIRRRLKGSSPSI
jgi:type VI secretion system secreted protein VgrG